MSSAPLAFYNFATVVDDAMMAPPRIIRGDDHLPPRIDGQVQAWNSLPMPTFAHISILRPRRQNSPSAGATSVGTATAAFLPHPTLS